MTWNFFGRRKALAIVAIWVSLAVWNTAPAWASRCLFVSSYHQGYAWSDGVERGLRSVLEPHCELQQYDMDTKRNKSEADKHKAAFEARHIIDTWQPDVVITADDNAAKYLIVPYYKDHELPFVFAGINWTVEEYGFPYSNVTGMIEVAPIRFTLQAATEATGGRTATYLGANTLTEEKNLARFQSLSEELGITLHAGLVDTSASWLEAYEKAQDKDFVILGSNAGIADWSNDRIQGAVLQGTRVLSVTNHEWMMPFGILGMTKIPEEHGEWAGKAALQILAGTAPSSIPIIANQRQDIWVNGGLMQASGVSLPEDLLEKAKAVPPLE